MRYVANKRKRRLAMKIRNGIVAGLIWGSILYLVSVTIPTKAQGRPEVQLPEQRVTVAPPVEFGEILFDCIPSLSVEFSEEAATTSLPNNVPVADESEAESTVAGLQFSSFLADVTVGPAVTILEAAMVDETIYSIASGKDAQPPPPWELGEFAFVDSQFDGAVVDSARHTALLLSCGDEDILHQYLLDEGVKVLDARTVRKLPDDFFYGVMGYEYAMAYCETERQIMCEVVHRSIVAVRYVKGSDAAVDYVKNNPDQRFVVFVDEHGLSVDALRTLAGENVVAVVVGHYHHADDPVSAFGDRVADIVMVARCVRLVSDAPILLAVSMTNLITRKFEPSWLEYFGDELDKFDGWAIYNYAFFPAIMEARDNPREAALARYSLSDKPCILVEFAGVGVAYTPAQRPAIEKTWKAKAHYFVKAMKEQGWRGLVTWSQTLDDAKIKADALWGAQ